MKAGEIKVGHTYKARVSGNLVDVRVEGIEEKVSMSGKRQMTYRVTNLNTKRKLIFKSAAKFRYEVTKPE